MTCGPLISPGENPVSQNYDPKVILEHTQIETETNWLYNIKACSSWFVHGEVKASEQLNIKYLIFQKILKAGKSNEHSDISNWS